MTHVSVYRRWRPKSFEELIGQERITHTLQNAIRAGRTSHAYLFAGHRGCGKTTTARILAKALNCAQGPTPTPDNTCANCDSINKGISLDVIEIDGASNTSVDDVRDLKEKIVLAPTQGPYKVYIIDEVHMLSTSAFNALLKTLEEPPAHAVFVLVTTEPQRIPATVLSRCQRFDFRRVSFAEITARLKRIAQQDGLNIDDAALAQIARTADGSVRDAESVLDQLSAYADGTIDRALVANVMGLVDEDMAMAFVGAALRGDVANALRLAQEATDAGKDSRQILRALLEHVRDLLMVKTCGAQAADILDAPKEYYTALAAQVDGVAVADLLRAVRILNDAVSDARWHAMPRLALEVSLIRIARPEMDPSLESVVARLERLETGAPVAASAPAARRPAPGNTPAEPPPPPPAAPPSPAKHPKSHAEESESAKPLIAAPPIAAPSIAAPSIAAPPITAPPITAPSIATPATPAAVGIDDVRRQWARVLEEIKRVKIICHALLIDGTPLNVNGDTLIVGLRSAYVFHMESLNRPENRDIVEGALAKILSTPLLFRCQLYDTPVPEGDARGAHANGESANAAGALPATSGSPATGASLVDRARELFGAQIVDEP